MMSMLLVHLFSQLFYNGQVIPDWECSCRSDRTCSASCFIGRENESWLPTIVKLSGSGDGVGKAVLKMSLACEHAMQLGKHFLFYTMRTVTGVMRVKVFFYILYNVCVHICLLIYLCICAWILLFIYVHVLM